MAADRFAAVFADEALPLPEMLGGRYRLGREVGRGGMAIVHIARDLKHGRDVAVKIVQPELAAALGRARFLREIEIAARLQHPHIVPVYDSGEEMITPADRERGEEETSILFYVMPYEPGPSLRERLSRDGPLSVNDAVLILHDVCEALSHAHKRGIVHRDIKPDNVLLLGPPCDGHRFRHRPSDERGNGATHTGHGIGLRNSRVHGAGAGGEGFTDRSSRGHLRRRRDGVRDAGGTAAVHERRTA